MTRKLDQRINNTFDRSSPDDIYKYLEWLRGSISELAQSVRRTMAIAILLMAIFVLISEAPKAVVRFGGFQINKGSLVLQFIPVFVAYLFLQGMVYTGRLSLLSHAFSRTYAKWSHTGEANDLDVLVLPSLPLYWRIEIGGDESYGIADRVDFCAGLVISAVIIGGVALFELVAYQSLYRTPDGHSGQLLLSAILSAIFIATGILYLHLSSDRWH